MIYKNLNKSKQNRLIFNVSWVSLFKTILNFIFPISCAGCSMADCVLCNECKSKFSKWHRDPFSGVFCKNIYSCATYGWAVRRCILQWKDHGNQLLDKPFSNLLFSLIISVVGRSSKVAIIPVPSSFASKRKRGRSHMEPIAKNVVKSLKKQGVDATFVKAIKMINVRGKSVQARGSRQRSLRTSKGLSVNVKGIKSGYKVIIIDDIITTGSTLKNCVKELNKSGVAVFACFALAGVWSKESVLYS